MMASPEGIYEASCMPHTLPEAGKSEVNELGTCLQSLQSVAEDRGSQSEEGGGPIWDCEVLSMNVHLQGRGLKNHHLLTMSYFITWLNSMWPPYVSDVSSWYWRNEKNNSTCNFVLHSTLGWESNLQRPALRWNVISTSNFPSAPIMRFPPL